MPILAWLTFGLIGIIISVSKYTDPLRITMSAGFVILGFSHLSLEPKVLPGHGTESGEIIRSRKLIARTMEIGAIILLGSVLILQLWELLYDKFFE
jgi:hypothetical protein